MGVTGFQFRLNLTLFLIKQPFGVSHRKKSLEATPEGISVPQKSFHSWDMQDFCVCSCTRFLTLPAHHEGWARSTALKCVPWQVKFWGGFEGMWGLLLHLLSQAFGTVHECLGNPVLFYQHWTAQQKGEQKDEWSDLCVWPCCSESCDLSPLCSALHQVLWSSGIHPGGKIPRFVVGL